MTHAELKYEELFTATYNLRHWQIIWDSYHIKCDGDKVRYWKQKVDAILKREAADRKSNQLKITIE